MPKTLADAVEYAKVLYYGIPGTGKTTNLAHLANLTDVVYILADQSIRTRPLREMGVPIERITPLDELDPVKLERTYCWQWQEALASDPDSFGICLDTATELVSRRIEGLVDEAWELTVTQAKNRHEEPNEKNRYFVNRDYYGVETQEMRRFLRHLRDLPCHVGISAQVRRDVDENSGKVMYGPDVNPAIQGDLLGWCEFVIRLELDGQYRDGDREDVFIGYCRPDETHHGKDRDGVLPRILAQPTMDRVIGYMLGDLDKDTDPVQARYRELVKTRRERRKT